MAGGDGARRRPADSEEQLQELQASLQHERVKRKADRVGRIRAEQELRAVKVQLQQLQLQLQLLQQPSSQQTELINAAETGREAACGASGTGRLGAAAEAAGEGPANATGSSASAGSKGSRSRLKKQAPAEAAGDDVCGLDEYGAVGGSAASAEGGMGEEDAPGSGRRGAQAMYETKRAAAAAAAALAAAGAAMPAFPFRPIGHLRSVFSERNGTPRQPQLVPAARSRLVLAPNVPAACLEGLQQYSHCWVLYVFHANTDLAKYLSPDRSGLKAKIHVPRLNGGRMGVLATRSPHRPSPIGLSTARIIGVEGNTLLLGGADIVDGSPVLDIKPYVPFCDCLVDARAPAWVQAEAEDEPLAVSQVVVGPQAAAALAAAWGTRRASSMYDSAESYTELQLVVSSAPPAATAAVAGQGGQASTTAGAAMGAVRSWPASAEDGAKAGPTGGDEAAGAFDVLDGGAAAGQYHVVLDHIYISYDIGPGGVVVVRDAWVDPITAK
ncbi:hypothetical protein GPECTOR_11g327 [Gonium pectorale]|uniref:TsaA-like domain-containing protein n=1 Tax=Gonium pectorale TaxID=33097 RepID=A0A150GQ27_GONPE|nr:hypothetical protein GPECTOR_11g327 [Gonium pectorale]|eukprot:KXZ51893.1 hypothetical protein GPECTOR_11g327 [Gonium pectorale]